MKSASRGDRLIRLPTSEGPESDPTSENGVKRLPRKRTLCAYRNLRHRSSFKMELRCNE